MHGYHNDTCFVQHIVAEGQKHTTDNASIDIYILMAHKIIKSALQLKKAT